MKLFNIFSLGVLMACTFSSCEMKKELTSGLEESFEMGALELDVTVKQPVSNSRAESNVPTNNFPVVIQGTSEGVEDVKKEYNTVDEVPEKIQVPVGNYNVSSHTPGELQKKMDAPYYAGNTDITVTKDIETVANVVCKMANSRIQVNYGDEFKTSFKSWTITVDDGSETALTFTNEDENPAPVYWLFDENVKSITVNITATTTSGNTVKDRRVFTKSDASENYEDVGDAFTGGDAIEINMGVTESTTGNVTGITINANITFENHEDTVDIPTIDEDEGCEDNPVIPNNELSVTCVDENGIDLFETGVQFASKSVYPATNIKILAKNGLKSLKVTINGGNIGFQDIVDSMNFVDFELVGETGKALESFLSGLGVLIPMPEEGCTDYTFPIGQFYSMMDMNGTTVDDYGADYHEFIVTAEDNNGNIVGPKSLKVTITGEE